MSLTLAHLKELWNEILDLVERENRIAWLAYFDARLVDLTEDRLTLDFSDPAKLSGAHDYTSARSHTLRTVIESAITAVTHEKIYIHEK